MWQPNWKQLQGKQQHWKQRLAALSGRMLALGAKDDGMSTVEYAIGTLAAAAFGAVLYTVVTGGSIASFLQKIIEKALTTSV